MITEAEFQSLALGQRIWVWLDDVTGEPRDGSLPLAKFKCSKMVEGEIIGAVTRGGVQTSIEIDLGPGHHHWDIDSTYGHEVVAFRDLTVPSNHLSSTTTVLVGGAPVGSIKAWKREFADKPLSCCGCGTVNEYAEPNLPDGKLACYTCRLWNPKLEALHEKFKK